MLLLKQYLTDRILNSRSITVFCFVPYKELNESQPSVSASAAGPAWNASNRPRFTIATLLVLDGETAKSITALNPVTLY